LRRSVEPAFSLPVHPGVDIAGADSNQPTDANGRDLTALEQA
jgi:hypothetical protein